MRRFRAQIGSDEPAVPRIAQTAPRLQKDVFEVDFLAGLMSSRVMSMCARPPCPQERDGPDQRGGPTVSPAWRRCDSGVPTSGPQSSSWSTASQPRPEFHCPISRKVWHQPGDTGAFGCAWDAPGLLPGLICVDPLQVMLDPVVLETGGRRNTSALRTKRRTSPCCLCRCFLFELLLRWPRAAEGCSQGIPPHSHSFTMRQATATKGPRFWIGSTRQGPFARIKRPPWFPCPSLRPRANTPIRCLHRLSARAIWSLRSGNANTPCLHGGRWHSFAGVLCVVSSPHQARARSSASVSAAVPRQGYTVCPQSGKQFDTSARLVPNLNLRDAISHWMAGKGSTPAAPDVQGRVLGTTRAALAGRSRSISFAGAYDYHHSCPAPPKALDVGAAEVDVSFDSRPSDAPQPGTPSNSITDRRAPRSSTASKRRDQVGADVGSDSTRDMPIPRAAEEASPRGPPRAAEDESDSEVMRLVCTRLPHLAGHVCYPLRALSTMRIRSEAIEPLLPTRMPRLNPR